MRVGVIGAGAAGLSAGRYLSEQNGVKFTIYEQTSHVGGTWKYNEETGRDKHHDPVHSSMYHSLKTNIPKGTMCLYPDSPFPSSLPSYITHKDVQKYLVDFTEQHGIDKHIRLDTKVDEIIPIKAGESHFPKWQVKSTNLANQSKDVDEFDGLMICNWHFSVTHNKSPRSPSLSSTKVKSSIVMSTDGQIITRARPLLSWGLAHLLLIYQSTWRNVLTEL